MWTHRGPALSFSFQPSPTYFLPMWWFTYVTCTHQEVFIATVSAAMTITKEPPLVVVGFRSTGGEVFRSTGGEGLAKVKAEPSALAWISFINYENVPMKIWKSPHPPNATKIMSQKRENRIEVLRVSLWAGDVSTWPAGASCLQLTYPSTSIDSQRNWYWRSEKYPRCSMSGIAYLISAWLYGTYMYT